MFQAEEDELIEAIFSKRDVFEKHILGVYSDEGRVEIMEILSKRMIHVLLKDEFNFLYMNDLRNFKFSLIINLLFREIANEWVSFAIETLMLTKDKALEEIQDKSRIVYILSIVKWYFKTYKSYFAKEIADTFIELVSIMPNPTLNNELIKHVIRSGFVRDQNISVVLNYNQLWSRVKNAHNNKNQQLSKIQIKISELVEEGESTSARKYAYESKKLEAKPLAFFDDAIMRLRETMVNFMLEIDSFKD